MTTLLNKLNERAESLIAQMETVETRASERENLELNDDEKANLAELRNELKSVESRIEIAEQTAESVRRVAQLRKRAESGIKADTSAPDTTERSVAAVLAGGSFGGGSVVNTNRPITVNDAPIYRTDDKGQFIRDVVASGVPELSGRVNPGQAPSQWKERMARHAVGATADDDVVTRNVATSNLAGLVIPQYRRDVLARGVYHGKVVASLVRNIGFPGEGVQVHIPRISTEAAVAVQSAEDAEISETSPATESVQLDMTTIAAHVDISVQAVEQGIMTEQVILEELQMATGERIEEQVLNGSGASGQVRGIRNTTGPEEVTWDAANSVTPTFALFWPQLGKLITNVSRRRNYRPDCIVFGTQTWGWLAHQLDGNNRPLFTTPSQGPFANIGVGDPSPMDASMPMPVGMLSGINAYVSHAVRQNISVTPSGGTATSTGSEVYAFNSMDPVIAESSQVPTVHAALETSDRKLNIRFTAYCFLFFTPMRYPKGIGIMKGTGLRAAL